MEVAHVAALARDLNGVGAEEAGVTGHPGHLVARELMLKHLDFVIERDVEPPPQILRRDVGLVAVGAAIEAALAPAGEIQHGLAQLLRWDCSGMDTNTADAPPAPDHQYVLFQLCGLHCRAPAGGAGANDDKVIVLHRPMLEPHRWLRR